MGFQLMLTNAWDDLGNNVTVSFAEALSAFGLFATVATGMPVSLATGLMNVPLVVPATTRLFLMLGCDVILILARSFQAASDRCIGQPLKGDLAKAARAYRPFAKGVHAAIAEIVPRRNLVRSYRVDKVRLGFREVIERHRPIVVEGRTATNALPLVRPGPAFTPRKVEEDDLETESTDSTSLDGLVEDVKEMQIAAPV
jgi:hypothetical protein